VEDGISSSDLLEEDKMAILLSARVTGYGSEYRVPLYCEECSDTREFTFDLEKKSFEAPKEKIEYDSGTDTFSLVLPLSGIKLHLLNFNKTHSLEIEKDMKRKERLISNLMQHWLF